MNTPKQLLPIPVLVASVMLAWVAGFDSIAGESQGDQPAVIGKPFRVSASVTSYCAMQPRLMMCEAFEPQLAEFLAETRDARWAAPVERLIARSMLVNGRPWAQIRALECRSTRCALEYAVAVDDLGRDVDGDEELDKLMEPVGGVALVPELPAGPGKGVFVNVLIWRKPS